MTGAGPDPAVDPTALDPAPGELPAPAERPTLYFIGVTTGRSSIRRVFPRWAERLGLTDAVLVGIDLPLHAPREDYRRVVDFVRRDPLSLGALVTTHKIDLYEACTDLFDEVDPLARLMGETSCLSKRDGKLLCHAKDPISSGLAVDALLRPGHWRESGAEALLLGAGGSALAISWCLTSPDRGDDRPARVVAADLSPQRLEALRAVHTRSHDGAGADVPLEVVHSRGPQDNDALLAGLRPGALVVNATGLGKDAPGSPLTDRAVLPRRAVAWELNYRGDLVFLDQARAAPADRGVRAEDGWVYFLHGWTQVVAQVFDVEIPPTGPVFDELGRIAAETR